MKCPYAIKVCTKCKRILVANEINFKKAKKGKWRLASNCKECDKKYYKENKEKTLKDKKEYNKKYYENNKEKLLKNNKEYYKKWREGNREYHKEKSKEYYKNNKERIKEKARIYHKSNPEKEFNKSSKRRLRKENQGKGITKEQWIEMMEFFGWYCAYSGESLNKDNRSIDHIKPLSKGGEHEIWNCVPMLKDYNSSKHTKEMEDWYMEQDFFNINKLLKIYEWIEYAYNKWSK